MDNLKFKRQFIKKLSFEWERLMRDRHKFHSYPAMLHPLLVDYLIDRYADEGDVIFDPFCGSGVTLFQASVSGHKSYGFDINPLALLIAQTKTTDFNPTLLEEEYWLLRKYIETTNKSDIPDIKNIDYWYTAPVQKDLGKIRYSLKNTGLEYKNLFILLFAHICRDQSLTRNSEFKRYRVASEKIDTLENRVFEKFFQKIEEAIHLVKTTPKPTAKASPILGNSETDIPPDITYDIVITSPPYWDSRTTVAYGEYSSFWIEWTQDLNPYGIVSYKVDKEAIGKKRDINTEILNCDILSEIVGSISLIDKNRWDDVLHFFNWYFNVIRNVIKNLNEKGTACFVVGNRTVKWLQIPMDQITACFLEIFGLKIEGIYVRDIHSKIMPSKNSPSNKAGETKSTMLHEYIVVAKKAF